MKEVLKDIQSGKFTKDWMNEHKAGQKNFLKMRKKLMTKKLKLLVLQLKKMINLKVSPSQKLITTKLNWTMVT